MFECISRYILLKVSKHDRLLEMSETSSGNEDWAIGKYFQRGIYKNIIASSTREIYLYKRKYSRQRWTRSLDRVSSPSETNV